MKVIKAMANQAPIILVYGAEGRGKTTLAAKSPVPLALLLERGLPRGITIDAIDGIDSLESVMSALREVYANPGGFKTLVIDTLDALESLLIADLCNKNNWKTIEAPSFGKGWVAADTEWRRFIRAIIAIRNKHGMSVLMTCHATIERIDDPRAPTYTAYAPRLHKRGRGLVMDACDAVLFLAEDLHTVVDGDGFHERTRAAASDQRFIFAEGRPAFAAKNRLGIPAKVPIPLNFDFANLARYWAVTETTP